MPIEPHRRFRDLVRPTVYAIIIALVLGGIGTVKGYVAGRSAPNEFGWDEAFLTNMPWWLLWALVAPLIFWLVRVLPLRGPRLILAVAGHFIVSLGLSVGHLVVAGVGVWLAVAHEFTTMQGVIRDFLGRHLVSGLVTYWALVAAYSTYNSYYRLREAERERHELALRASRLEAEAAQLEAKMIEARLEALRMELNPHFLFNTLNTASALTQEGEGDLAVEVLARLSELLRRTLYDKTDHEITLEEEMDLLEQYLVIQRIRFRDRLTVDVQSTPEVRKALVPTLILQPLAENAMLHGVSAVRGMIRLQVQASRLNGNVLELVMRDSGPGFESEAALPHAGIGLANTRNRLAALYGDDASVQLRSPPGGGAEVVLTMPLRVDEDVRVET
jgi:two-component sensor histidine kinase